MEEQTKVVWDVDELKELIKGIRSQKTEPKKKVKRRGTKAPYNFAKKKRRRKIAKATKQKQRRRG